MNILSKYTKYIVSKIKDLSVFNYKRGVDYND